METILVVDDEDDIRVVVRKMLEAKGYTVLDAGDPHQALRIVTQQPVHLLLTDVVMPLMRGTELAQRFQAVSPWTKVLLMSAYKVAEIAASGHPFIPKPPRCARDESPPGVAGAALAVRSPDSV